MTLAALYALLNGTGVPVAYGAWPSDPAPPLPRLCYSEDESDNFAADGVVYFSAASVSVELYTAEKDPESESKVEAALSSAGIFWEKSESYLDSERCFLINFQIEV